MSDLLGNLVSKTLNLAPTIAPRPLSRFEPWQSTGMAETRPLDSVLEMDAQPVVTSVHPAEPMLDQRHDVSRRSDENTQPDRSAPVSHMTERIERVIVERNVGEPRQSDQDERESSAQHVVTAPMTPTEKANHPEPSTIIERIERLVVDRDQPALNLPIMGADRMRPTPMIETIAQTDHQSAAQMDEGRSPTRQPSAERPPTDRTSEAPTVIVQSLAVPPTLDVAHEKHPRPTPIVERLPITTATKPTVRSDNALAQRSMPPTIQVSIGRVEVRATLPPTPTKRPASSTSTTSLDEYLRRRAGGRR